MEKETLKTIFGILGVIVAIIMIGFAWGHQSDNEWELLPVEKKIERIEMLRDNDPHCGLSEPDYMQACNIMYDNDIKEAIEQEREKQN